MINYKTMPLWQHQLTAIQHCEKYLKGAEFTQNFLTKMPTGSGKTGIMAVLSRIIFPRSNFLIVVPSVVLKEQLVAQLSVDFWEDKRKMKIKASDLPNKDVVGFLPKDVDAIVKNHVGNTRSIYICVVNTLHLVKKDNPKGYQFLKDQVDYIFFDEGHKEPAYSWAKAVRDLEKKTILFSATPYRNDLKLFNISKEPGHYHFLTHQEAVAKKIVRDIEFRALEGSSSRIREQLERIWARLQKDRKNLSQGAISAKILIRCHSKKRIDSVLGYLRTKNISALGLHDRFSNETIRRCDVPSEDEMNPFNIVVHQNKLIEGVDNPNFLILVLLDDFDNERALIQQLGRICRNLDQKTAPKAIVYYWKLSVKNQLEEVWKKFISFDTALEKRLYDVFDLIKLNPDIQLIYLKNAIRTVQNMPEIGIDEIKVPKRTIIREVIPGKKVTVQTLLEWITADLDRSDGAIEQKFEFDDGCFLVYQSVFTSPYFERSAVLDTKYEIILFYLIGNLLFFLATTGRLPEFLSIVTRPLDPNQLLNLTAGSRRFSGISLVNSDLGKNTLRRRSFSGYSLKDVAPLLNDHNYIASNISAITKGFTDAHYLQRYVGIRTSKVSEYLSEYCHIPAYKNWICAIDRALKQPLAIPNYYNRYAKKINPPADCTPINILLEIQSDDNTEFSFNGQFDYEWLDVASKIENGSFEMSIQSKTGDNKVTNYVVDIEFDTETQKYILKSADVEQLFYSAENDQTLISYLNQQQSFRIVTKDNSSFYAFGSFYEPRLNLANQQNELDLLEILIPILDLKTIQSEKGDKSLKVSGGLWHPDTLFGLIARMGTGYKDQAPLQQYLNFTHLACDDLGNEMADFIGLHAKNKRVVVIHAKAKTAVLSASSFHDICGQATKKLDILSPFFEKAPEININRFDKPWSVKKIGVVPKRIIAGNVTGQQFWDLMEELIRDPQTTKEVYLVTGSMLDKSLLEAQLGLPSIKDVRPEMIDLIYLLRSTWSAVSSLGANLRVFCY
jgi:superfamily II DNA or RNA helicase